ncbi:unnamed protein product, partial [Closterium sp. Naga37s-1]
PVLLDCQALWIRNFTGWTTGEDCATAEGLQCDSNGMIVKMSMDMSSLAGVLPSSIGNLTLLTHLNFFQNNLDSDIPTTFGALTNLQHLNLGINMLTGPLPLFLDTLSLLTFLDLSKNNVSVSLRSTLGSLACCSSSSTSFPHISLPPSPPPTPCVPPCPEICPRTTYLHPCHQHWDHSQPSHGCTLLALPHVIILIFLPLFPSFSPPFSPGSPSRLSAPVVRLTPSKHPTSNLPSPPSHTLHHFSVLSNLTDHPQFHHRP